MYTKKRLLLYALAGIFSLMTEPLYSGDAAKEEQMSHLIKIFMCGDVMTGRGMDQILPHPSDPVLYEPYVKDAREYLELAGNIDGPIQKPVDFSYIWGDALEEFKRMAPDVKIINLETSITKSDSYWKGKSIHYRMSPENISCLTMAEIDFCSLANNHILDWGYSGLKETMETLKKANMGYAGAGNNVKESEAPAVINVGRKGRVIIFSYGSETSGIQSDWASAADRPGVNLLEDFSDKTVRHIKDNIGKVKQPGDIVIFSVHWGDNWGFDIPRSQIEFVHKLIDDADVDIIHGHSSHHVKGIEVYKDKLILYGAGDFLNDYEGIAGYEEFRDDLGLMYFAGVDALTGKLVYLQMIPTQVKRFKVNRATGTNALWLRETLNREGEKFNTSVEMKKDHALLLKWK
jgi:poly-gamma-glutamate capsule biosynthesis protein CapA/YwtB (metallophosphatase superfamily)